MIIMIGFNVVITSSMVMIVFNVVIVSMIIMISYNEDFISMVMIVFNVVIVSMVMNDFKEVVMVMVMIVVVFVYNNPLRVREPDWLILFPSNEPRHWVSPKASQRLNSARVVCRCNIFRDISV